jgi:hypothetical protein
VFSDTNPPKRCPNGHQLGPRRVLVGWDNLHDPPCRTWTCRRCDAVIYAHTMRWFPTIHLDGLHYVPKSD